MYNLIYLNERTIKNNQNEIMLATHETGGIG